MSGKTDYEKKYSRRTVLELKEFLAREGLVTAGKKAELVERICEYEEKKDLERAKRLKDLEKNAEEKEVVDLVDDNSTTGDDKKVDVKKDNEEKDSEQTERMDDAETTGDKKSGDKKEVSVVDLVHDDNTKEDEKEVDVKEANEKKDSEQDEKMKDAETHDEKQAEEKEVVDLEDDNTGDEKKANMNEDSENKSVNGHDTSSGDIVVIIENETSDDKMQESLEVEMETNSKEEKDSSETPSTGDVKKQEDSNLSAVEDDNQKSEVIDIIQDDDSDDDEVDLDNEMEEIDLSKEFKEKSVTSQCDEMKYRLPNHECTWCSHFSYLLEQKSLKIENKYGLSYLHILGCHLVKAISQGFHKQDEYISYTFKETGTTVFGIEYECTAYVLGHKYCSATATSKKKAKLKAAKAVLDLMFPPIITPSEAKDEKSEENMNVDTDESSKQEKQEKPSEENMDVQTSTEDKTEVSEKCAEEKKSPEGDKNEKAKEENKSDVVIDDDDDCIIILDEYIPGKTEEDKPCTIDDLHEIIRRMFYYHGDEAPELKSEIESLSDDQLKSACARYGMPIDVSRDEMIENLDEEIDKRRINVQMIPTFKLKAVCNMVANWRTVVIKSFNKDMLKDEAFLEWLNECQSFNFKEIAHGECVAELVFPTIDTSDAAYFELSQNNYQASHPDVDEKHADDDGLDYLSSHSTETTGGFLTRGKKLLIVEDISAELNLEEKLVKIFSEASNIVCVNSKNQPTGFALLEFASEDLAEKFYKSSGRKIKVEGEDLRVFKYMPRMRQWKTRTSYRYLLHSQRYPWLSNNRRINTNNRIQELQEAVKLLSNGKEDFGQEKLSQCLEMMEQLWMLTSDLNRDTMHRIRKKGCIAVQEEDKVVFMLGKKPLPEGDDMLERTRRLCSLNEPKNNKCAQEAKSLQKLQNLDKEHCDLLKKLESLVSRIQKLESSIDPNARKERLESEVKVLMTSNMPNYVSRLLSSRYGLVKKTDLEISQISDQQCELPFKKAVLTDIGLLEKDKGNQVAHRRSRSRSTDRKSRDRRSRSRDRKGHRSRSSSQSRSRSRSRSRHRRSRSHSRYSSRSRSRSRHRRSRSKSRGRRSRSQSKDRRSRSRSRWNRSHSREKSRERRSRSFSKDRIYKAVKEVPRKQKDKKNVPQKAVKEVPKKQNDKKYVPQKKVTESVSIDQSVVRKPYKQGNKNKQGNKKKGVASNFSHTKPVDMDLEGNSSDGDQSPNMKQPKEQKWKETKFQLCKYLLEDRCTRGDNCPFSHDPELRHLYRLKELKRAGSGFADAEPPTKIGPGQGGGRYRESNVQSFPMQEPLQKMDPLAQVKLNMYERLRNEAVLGSASLSGMMGAVNMDPLLASTSSSLLDEDRLLEEERRRLLLERRRALVLRERLVQRRMLEEEALLGGLSGMDRFGDMNFPSNSGRDFRGPGGSGMDRMGAGGSGGRDYMGASGSRGRGGRHGNLDVYGRRSDY